jgi:uncharacterized membrane protein
MTASFTPAIWIHLSAALAALALGAAVFLARKGTFLHRVSGRLWAGLMLVAAISSFWIKGNGSYSWIHLLSIVTLVLLAGVVYAAMSGHIRRHRAGVIGLYSGSLVTAGLFALLPARLLGKMVWGALGLL